MVLNFRVAHSSWFSKGGWFSFELRVTMTNKSPAVSGLRKSRVAQALLPVRFCRPHVRHQSNYDCKTHTGKSACATKACRRLQLARSRRQVLRSGKKPKAAHPKNGRPLRKQRARATHATAARFRRGRSAPCLSERSGQV
jgi:hypothetical protein